MKITEISLKRPRIVFLVVLLVALAGFFALSSIPKEGDPDIQIPMAFIVTFYPGAGPDEVETLVANKIEDAMVDLPDLDYTYSSISEGLVFTQVIFSSDADLDDSMNKVRERVDKVNPDLPDGCQTPEVLEFSLSDIPIMVLSVSAEMDRLTLRETAENLADELKKIPGVLDTSVVGGVEREIQIRLKPAKLTEFQISPQQVVGAIGAQHLQMPAGTIEIGPQRYLVRAFGEFEDSGEMAEIIVSNASGTRVKLSEIADIVDGPAEVTSNSRTNGQESVSIYVKRRTNSNVLETSTAIKQMLGIPEESMDVTLADGRKVKLRPSEVRSLFFATSEGFTVEVRDYEGEMIPVTRGEVADQIAEAGIDPTKATQLPPGVITDITSDQADEVNESLDTMGENILAGVAIVILVLFLFMGLRTALMVSAAIPLSLMIAIAVIYFTGGTLNSMTISGLILVVGMLVDNAIVVVQNIYRHIEMGEDRKIAAVKATGEIAYPVFTSTMTTIFAFLPILMMSGVMGDFMSFIPIAVSLALFASLFVGLILAPPIAANFIRLKKTLDEWKHEKVGPIRHRLNRIRIWLNNKLNLRRLGNWYERIIRGALRHRKLVFVLTILAFFAAISLPAMGLLKVELFPPVDVDSINVNLETPIGTPLGITDEKVKQLERIVTEHIPEMDRLVAISGNSPGGGHRVNLGGFFGITNSHEGGVIIDLIPSEDRERTAREIQEDLRPHLTQVGGVDIYYAEFSGGPPIGAPINIKVYGDDLDEQRRIADQLIAHLETIPGVRDPYDDISPGTPEIQAVLRRQEANLLGFTSYDLAVNLSSMINGVTAGVYREGDEEYDIVVKIPKERLDSLGDLESLFVSNFLGNQAMVGDIARIVQKEGISSIRHYNGDRAVTVGADLLPGYSPVEVTASLKGYVDESIVLPTGYRIDYEGSYKFIEESFSDLGSAALLAVLLIFIILTLQFGSFAQPITVMSTILLASVGAIAGLAITGSTFTIVAFIAIIGLAGVVVNGAIVLVDFINQRRREGMPMREAIVDAGKVRLTPILLTAITTIGAMFPLAISDPQWAPLGWSFIFGLAFSTILTLVVVPTLYSWLEDVKVKIKMKLFKNYVPAQDVNG
ncbi:efflux RND transporter permease subunit [bacterium]|nr:efflux RND transporter permease subunit [bacterium]